MIKEIIGYSMSFLPIPKEDDESEYTEIKVLLDLENCILTFTNISEKPIDISKYNGYGVTSIIDDTLNTFNLTVNDTLGCFAFSLFEPGLMVVFRLNGNIDSNKLTLTLVVIIPPPSFGGTTTLDLSVPLLKEAFIYILNSSIGDINNILSRLVLEPMYIDLSLPSGTLWAKYNVGAIKETDYGEYFMYGMGAKPYNSTDLLYAGTEDPLAASADTATQVWGGEWHMPTQAQMQELTANTTYQWVTDYNGSGINGGLFTAQNGNSVFFPAAGYWGYGRQFSVGDDGDYWGSSPNGSDDAYLLSFGNFGNGYEDVSDGSREYGYSVRPVIG